MRWLDAHYRHAMERFGFDYPPGYMMIADLAVVTLCVAAVVQRGIDGVHGAAWLWPVAGALVSVAPHLLCLVAPLRPWVMGLAASSIISVVLFWQTPVHVDVASLLLPLSATVTAAIATGHRGLITTAALSLTAVGGGLAGVIDQGWLLALMVGFAGVVGHLMQKQLHLLRAERTARMQQAALDRAAIAGEIHDVLAHSLSIVLLNVTAARRALREDGAGPDDDRLDDDRLEAAEALEDAEKVGRAAMHDVRHTIELLRGEGVDGDPQPGVADLDDLIHGFRRAGVEIDDDLADVGPVTAGTGLAVYRVVQESLSNASRHAPGAPVTVHVGPAGDGRLVIRVANPVPPNLRRGRGGSGLRGMGSRVRNLGGTVDVGVVAGRWMVEATLPAGIAEVAGPGGCARDHVPAVTSA
jgi:signal transduction histidine kinase